MMGGASTVLVIAFALSLLLTLVCERVARRTGMVARQREDRWHRQPIPLLGGVAIALATLTPLLILHSHSHRLVILMLGLVIMAGVGLADDIRGLSPQTKLIAQVLVATGLLYFGFVLRLTGLHFVDTFLTLFWLVGITNAFNLLDNMDGLAATIACLAAAFRLLFFHWDGDVAGVQASAALIGGLLGFLVRNFAPAKIFMGDTGSLFIGLFLAGSSLMDPAAAYSRGVVAVLVIPVLLLLIPIFDTGFVTVTRLLSGRSIAVGGRDHTSHRLVAVGLTERQAVLVLAALSAAAGGVAVLSYLVGLSQTVVLLALLLIGLVLLGVYLSRVRIVRRVDEPDGATVLRLLADLPYKRQVTTLILDVALVLVAYYAAYVIRFEQTLPQHLEQLYGSMPIVLLIQLTVFAGFGLYRGIWRYTGIADMLRIVKATAVAAMATLVAITYLYRFVGFSRTVFILDGLLLMVLLAGSRASFRFFGEMFRLEPDSFQRVLIYGAGDGGELIVRELLNNPALERVPVGFIDDDRTKHRTRIHGLPVLGDGASIEAIIRNRHVNEVIVSSPKIEGHRFDRTRESCSRLGVRIRYASFRLE